MLFWVVGSGVYLLYVFTNMIDLHLKCQVLLSLKVKSVSISNIMWECDWHFTWNTLAPESDAVEVNELVSSGVTKIPRDIDEANQVMSDYKELWIVTNDFNPLFFFFLFFGLTPQREVVTLEHRLHRQHLKKWR